MKQLDFNKSSEVTIGVELEFQIIDPYSFSLVPRASDVLKSIHKSEYKQKIKPELTQGMIEINSSVHHGIKELYQDLCQLYNFLLQLGSPLNIFFCGGGVHPFQKWKTQKIFVQKREYKIFAKKYDFLAKRATVFGQHMHIGCDNPEDALYLAHALSRYVPHFIAISASSPFYQGVDTGFVSSRSTVFKAFPFSGAMPLLKNWNRFSRYFYDIYELGIIKSIDDFLWDIRIQPKFGTVEIRVCDTPLTLEKVVLIAAYFQSLSLYLLKERPITISEDLYFLYNYNHFQASRYGFNGHLIDGCKKRIGEDILTTIKKIEKYTQQLQNNEYIESLIKVVKNKNNDAKNLKNILNHTQSFQDVVSFQCQEWAKFF
ncbi:YbdK family carboxylate-amine ligase [Legionella longbeachae]|uniref:Putative glutamate--cysteine ligase 2 n=1 Tax=Legionella longbeachae serogroup 1 (strain NSW150) TaxID=661367 RepID=D3HJH7_LEGLN|nr:YbdK family carboxylate-amine ligase [Legionella longbeachae]VEE03106.1 carboxylate-amine ligase [Legionella oakridgensis]HBD7399224.1 glutamate--cysteine ligase [Legionella pneumophila]ARB93993.1 glutamate--cysteine ligase [Legionella longbeachae]ARM32869.1 glutamate--cysteine ligase [Legionella longbeachae]EEZ94322.1 carboxylate-amine ligase YbdK [Legionella longbeachae D-4968]